MMLLEANSALKLMTAPMAYPLANQLLMVPISACMLLLENMTTQAIS